METSFTCLLSCSTHGPLSRIFKRWGRHGNRDWKRGWSVGLRCRRQNGWALANACIILRTCAAVFHTVFPIQSIWTKTGKCSSSVRSWGEREKDWLIKIRWDEELEFRQGNAKATVSDIRYVTTVMSPILGDRHTACTEKLVTTFKFLRSNSILLLDGVRVYFELVCWCSETCQPLGIISELISKYKTSSHTCTVMLSPFFHNLTSLSIYRHAVSDLSD